MDSTRKEHWSTLFIREPVWAIVLVCFITLLGLKSVYQLQVRQFPDIEQGVITIRSTYVGAPADLMKSSVTQPLSRAIAQADGIDFIESQTSDSVTEITVHLKVNYSIDKAFTDILSQIQSVKRELPAEIDDPEITKGTGRSAALLYVAYTSKGVDTSLVYNYLDTVLRPQLSILPGVGKISILGAQKPAMRVWLDLEKMQHYRLSIQEVNQSLYQKNFLLPSGKFRQELTESSLVLETQGKSQEYFENLVIRQNDEATIVLSDIANIELGSKNDDFEVFFNGEKGVFLAVDMLPASNALTVIKTVREYLEKIESVLPEQMTQSIVYDATTFIADSVYEVIKTIVEAVLIVLVVMYLFLKSHRAVFISLTAIPLSLLGVFVLMQVAGLSLNLLTLLAMILAIGLVIDDAIIVVENCSRYLESGMTRLQAAKKGIQEIANPVIAMTLTLAVAYSPMVFLEGLIGGLFREFAFTLAGAVLVSGFIALTLSPMLCAYTLEESGSPHPSWLKRMTNSYEEALLLFFKHKKFVLIFSILILLGNIALYSMLSSELAPKEDQGFAMVAYNAPLSNNLTFMSKKSDQIKEILNSYEEKEAYFLINGFGKPQTGFGGFVAKPISQRLRSMDVLEDLMTKDFSKIINLEVFSFTPSALPGIDGLPFEMVLYGPFSEKALYKEAKILEKKLYSTGMFPFLRTNISFNKPTIHLNFDQKAIGDADLVSRDLASSLLQVLSDNATGDFNWFGQKFDVILKSSDLSVNEIFSKLPLMNRQGDLMTLSQVATMDYQVSPNLLYQYNQLNAISIQGAYFPTFNQSDIFNELKASFNELDDKGFFVDFLGQTRTYIEEGQGLMITFLFAMIVIYLILSAQFRSFLDPLIILYTVPLATCGTLIMMNLMSFVTMAGSAYKYLDINLNIYTQLGLLTLIGLMTKHGVLIVEFANEKMKKGTNSFNAVVEAAKERFRPILMTTATMIAGSFPLLLATGSGAVSRLHLGSVIISGLCLGTLFTLFIIPVIYDFFKKSKV
jgi:hydrophobe/amphiphile efflux-1 (HAE1) family protein